MDAKELRIGNYTLIGKMIIRVSFWTRIDALWYFLFGIKDFNVMNPVQLTEEWFISFGFEPELDDNFNYWVKGVVEITDILDGEFEFDNTAFSFRYVHQLQNLYYGITGKELKKEN